MTRQDAIRAVEPMDPIWNYVYPVFHLGVALYGLVAALVPLPSLRDVNSAAYAIGWGSCLMIVGLICAYATALRPPARRRRPWLEAVATTLLISLLIGYASTIYVSTIEHHQVDRLAGAIAPLLLCIFPAVDVLVIVRSGRLRAGRH